MTTRADIYTAIKNADAAGDSDSVQKLGAYLQTMPADASNPTDASAIHGLALGIVKPIDNAVSAVAHTPVGRAIDRAGTAMGLPSADAAVAANDAARTNNARTGFQAAGSVIGTLPLSALKGGQFVQGAVSGAALSDKHDLPGVASDALLGGATGVLAGTAVKGLANLARPYVSKGAALLRDAGVPLTLGQLAKEAGSASGFIGRTVGGFARGTEEALTSVPVLGSLIRGAQDRGTVAYNQSVLNRALAGIGSSLPSGVAPGRESVAATADALSKGYQAIVPKLSATTDLAFKSGVDNAVQSTMTLPDSTQKQFRAIITDVFRNRASPGNAQGIGATLTGQDLKDAESALTAKIKAYSAPNADPDQKGMADALSNVRDEFRALVARSNPADAAQLAALNSGWAQLKTAEKASLASGGDGIFTPKQYAAAAKAADASKSATARGRFPNQATTDAAASILSPTLPNSGTADRLAIMHAAPTIPAFAIGATVGAPYTAVGQRAINSLFLGNRGPVGATSAVALRELAKYAPVAAPALVARHGQ